MPVLRQSREALSKKVLLQSVSSHGYISHYHQGAAQTSLPLISITKRMLICDLRLTDPVWPNNYTGHRTHWKHQIKSYRLYAYIVQTFNTIQVGGSGKWGERIDLFSDQERGWDELFKDCFWWMPWKGTWKWKMHCRGGKGHTFFFHAVKKGGWIINHKADTPPPHIK